MKNKEQVKSKGQPPEKQPKWKQNPSKPKN